MSGAPGVDPAVVVVEDEPHIRRFLRTALASGGATVFEAETCERGLLEAANRKPDLVIVDLGLPDRDGLDLIATVRGWSNVPILVLSARSREDDKVRALDAGADDYLTKPFGVGELLARYRALLRRHLRGAPGTPAPLRFGRIEVDPDRRTVTRDGEPVHLTRIEFRLLCQLAAHPGRVMTQRQLLTAVWGPNHVEHSHYLRVYMAALRRKLEDRPAFPDHLRTESGVGYRLVP